MSALVNNRVVEPFAQQFASGGQLPWLLDSALKRLSGLWLRASLSIKFAAMSALILLFGMVTVGQWMSAEVAQSTVQSRAAAAVLHLNSIVQPLVQGLSVRAALSASDRAALDGQLAADQDAHALAGFRIWTPEGIVYSDRKDLVGRNFKLSGERARAWSGDVVARLISERDDAHPRDSDDFHPARDVGEPLLEIYAPVRETGTNRVIALAETYERVPDLIASLWWTRIGSWVVVANIGLIIFAAQLSIVHNGTLTIERQRRQLNERIDVLTKILNENNGLRHANQAGIRASEVTERYLRRIGADLHDGPLQLIGATMFRLDSLDAVIADADPAIVVEAREDIGCMRESITASLTELRDLAAGFMLPEIERMPLSQAIGIAAKRHERRTGQPVQIQIADSGDQLSAPLKVCLYRFVQEALNNAFRHGKAGRTTITGHCSSNSIDITVCDQGLGFDLDSKLASGRGLGLFGLRDRIEALGGALSIESKIGTGTSLTARFWGAQWAIEEEQA